MKSTEVPTRITQTGPVMSTTRTDSYGRPVAAKYDTRDEAVAVAAGLGGQIDRIEVVEWRGGFLVVVTREVA
jgi:hypothetical protein